MKTGECNRHSFASTRVRLWCYVIIFALILGGVIVEMKTGYRIGTRGFRTHFVHYPWSWDTVRTQLFSDLLSGEVAPYLFAFVMIVVPFELWARFGTSDPESEISDSLNDSPTKSFTRLWLTATVGYMVVLIALYVYSGSEWARDMPLPVPVPLAAIAPVFVSLGLLAIYTGEVWLRYSKIYRNKNPIAYWLCVAMALSLGIFMFLAGIGAIGQ